MNRNFIRSSYDEHNQKAIATAQQFLLSQGLESRVPLTEKYKSYDFIASFNGTDLPVEVEVKTFWNTTSKWNYRCGDSVHVAERKKDSDSAMFIMINNLHDTLIMCSMHTIKSSPVVQKNTVNMKNEDFFSVPLSSFKMYTKSNNEWVPVFSTFK